MIITICGSISHINQMNLIAEKLRELGHIVLLPQSAEEGMTKEVWDDLFDNHRKKFVSLKSDRMKEHFKKIVRSDAILVTNYEKRGIANYIGPNTLMEMAITFHLEKPIFLLNDVPDIASTEEIIGMNPILLNGNLNNIS